MVKLHYSLTSINSRVRTQNSEVDNQLAKHLASSPGSQEGEGGGKREPGIQRSRILGART